MSDVSFWSVLGMISDIAKSLNEAAEDGKITIQEALGIVKMICGELGIDFDTEGLDIEDLKDKISELINDHKD